MPAKTKQSETQKIPKLRFAGFCGEWEEKKLGKILDYEQPTNYIVENTEYSNDYNIPVLTAGKTFILGYTNETNGVFEVDNLPVIIFDDFTTAQQFVNFPFKVKSSAMKILKNKNKEVSDIRFIFSAMQRIRFGLGEEHKRFWISEYSKIKIPFPSLPEQQKIAGFLGVVDEWIENLRGQKESLESYKKGMMQKIFSQEVRFRDDKGNDFAKWEEKRLGEVVNNIGGTTLEKFVSEDGDYNFISIGNYSTDGKYVDNGQRIILNEKTKSRLLEKNNLVMVLNDKTASGDLIGSTILINKNNKFIYNQRSERIICKKSFDPLFAWHFLNSLKFRKSIFSISQGGTQIYVNFPSVKKIKIKIPKNIEEQQKIANFLTSIDNLINSKQQQITQ
ncbi:MAG: restriction endonuclease subunit S, partial [Patescibacteria group bacterium]|nr:restriction endonuclease subunit S [Patescibacteria group bacterium]